MTDREKLIKVITEPISIVESPLGDEFAPKIKMGLIYAGNVADHLIANGVTFQKWIPVSERLPWEELKKEKSIMEHLRSAGVIGYISGAVFAVEVYFADDGNFYFFEDSDPDIGEDFDASNAVKVEYWMPLPEPPKENDNEM